MSDPPSRPPRGERRRKILSAARHLLQTAGPAALSLDEIARVAGVSAAQLSRSFDSTAEVVQSIFDEYYEQLTAELPELDENDPVTRFHAQTNHLYQQVRQASELRQLLLRLLAEPHQEFSRVVVGFLDQLTDLIEPTITAGQLVGVFRRTIKPRVAAAEWLHGFLGMLLIDQPSRSSLPQSDATPAMWSDCFLHGLLKTDI